MDAMNPRSVDPVGPRRPKGLGRGLAALIPGVVHESTGTATEIPVQRIKPNSFQPRREFDAEQMADLEASIREQGVLQPVLLRPSGDGYELVAGERRWRAAIAAGLPTVPALVREMDDRHALEAALVENLQREDLNPIDRAMAYQRLMGEFGLSQDAVARRVGRSQPSVANTLRLLTLPKEVQTSVQEGRLSEGHARALLAAGDADKVLAAWRKTEGRGLSVRQVERMVKQSAISREIPFKSRSENPEIYSIQRQLADAIGAPVRVTASKAGRGEIRISFFSADDLERLLGLLGIQR